MILKPLLHLILILFTMLPLSSRAEGEDHGAPAAAAARFVALLDAGTADAAWAELTPLAKIIKSEAQWLRVQQSLRAAYGPLEKRTLRGVTLQSRYTMLPDGHYAIVQFDTVFRDKRIAIETIILAQRQDGRWQVHDYINN